MEIAIASGGTDGEDEMRRGMRTAAGRDTETMIGTTVGAVAEMITKPTMMNDAVQKSAGTAGHAAGAEVRGDEEMAQQNEVEVDTSQGPLERVADSTN